MRGAEKRTKSEKGEEKRRRGEESKRGVVGESYFLIFASGGVVQEFLGVNAEILVFLKTPH